MIRDEQRTRNRSESWYRIQNAAEGSSDPAEVFIYDEIDSWYGVSADTFVRDLAALDAAAITVRINSPGGSVFDGIAIMNALRGHKATITTVIDGLAASAASFIAMAGDEIVMRRNSEMMIHDASGITSGNAQDMLDMAENLERASNNIASIYAERAGGTVQDWRAAMGAETWFSDQEAVDAGLADRVETAPATSGDTAAAKASFDLSIFNYAGRRAAPAPTALSAPSPSAERVEVSPNREDDTRMSTLNEGLRKALGIEDADLTDEALLEKITAALAERDEAAETAEVTPSDDEIIVDRAAFESLKAEASLGRVAHERLQAEDRRHAVENAVRTGRITPASREKWINRLTVDPTEVETLAALEPVFPVNELGHAGEPDVDSDAALMSKLFGEAN